MKIGITFSVLGKGKVGIPAGDENHVICEVFFLDFELLEAHDISFKSVEHLFEGAVGAPWVVTEWVSGGLLE